MRLPRVPFGRRSNPSDEKATNEKVKNFGQDQPIGRPAQPEELAPAYVFLASEAGFQLCHRRHFGEGEAGYRLHKDASEFLEVEL